MLLKPSIDASVDSLCKLQAEAGSKVWLKTYESEIAAFIEAVELGLATEHVVEVERFTVSIRRTLKPVAEVEEGQLKEHGFTEA